MYFKRIDMQGFKSFAEPVSIEFDGGITCIVGPNGSGKSNISDAIRWALGEQSPKMLRGGKMEEVIFAGTASRKSRGMAEVTLVIDNSTGILPIDYNEVAITRRMYRSGESEYFINSNQCRLRDIRELIMDTGIGVDGYSLIGQGKIADIVSNKPESRREIFEEAAGIVMYRAKKADSEKKLEAASANLERVDDIIAELESRIGGLKEESEKAALYLSLRERYKALEINITLKNIESIELKNEYITDDISEASSGIDEIKEEKAAIDGRVGAAREKAEVLDKLSEETREKLLKSVEEINELVNRSRLSSEKLSRMERDEKRLAEEISSYADKLAKEDANEKELTAGKREADARLKALENELLQTAEKHAGKAAESEAALVEIDAGKSDIFKIQNEINLKAGEINSLEGLKSTLDRRKERLISEKRGAELAEKDFRGNFDRASAELTSIKSGLTELLAEKDALRVRYNESLAGEKKLSGELEELRILMGQLSSRQKTIEEMESNYEGYSGAVKFLMKSGAGGICGVVAEIIKVPRGFEVAVETALGAALQNIVCEDDASAQAAIRALKESKAGRLTFLPVSSIKPSGGAPASFQNEKGFKGLGSNCVSFEPKYRNIAEYLLGRTVIVDTLENAVRMSKSAAGNFRFVSMEGEIINASGAMTGGAYKNRTANLLERKSEVVRLKERLDEAGGQKAEKAASLKSLRELIENTAGALAAADDKYRAGEVALLKKENELEAARNAIADFNNGMNERGRELESIAEEQSGIDGMIAGLESAVADSKEKMAETERKLEASLAEYGRLKPEAESVSEEITKIRIAVSSGESERDNIESLMRRIRGAIEEMTREKNRKEGELTEILAEREALLAGDAGSAGDLKEKEDEKAAIENYLEELAEERSEAMRALTESTREKDALDEKLSAFQSQKYELEIKKAKNETQLDNYKDKLWEEFEISYIQAIEFRKKEFHMPSAQKESREIKNSIKELGEVNVGAIREYETVGERYAFLTGQRADALEAMNSLKSIIGDMDKVIREKFKESFDKVVTNFTDIFQSLFGGGYAELRLEDETRPLESGIEIIAQPPGKKLQNINLMSGGEKTMTAIALMFAVLKTKPTPFCILDEIEAALDDANIDKFAKYLRSFNSIQFTLVTHQKATMEHADVLYGVTMPEQGISKVISLRFKEDYDRMAQALG